MRSLQISLAAFACSLLACGPATLDWRAPTGEAPTSAEPPKTKPWVNKTPKLMVASPPAMAVGDALTIIGEDFVEPLIALG